MFKFCNISIKYCLWLIFLLGRSASLSAQKPLITENTFGNWPNTSDFSQYSTVSNDGKYVLYTINNQPNGAKSLILQAIDTTWKIEIPNVDGYSSVFSSDSRFAVFRKSQDSIGIVLLGRSSVKYVSNISSFQLPKNGNEDWIAYQLNTSSQEVYLLNLMTGEQKIFSSIFDYTFSENGNVLVLQIERKLDSVNKYNLLWVDVANGKTHSFWQGTRASHLTFDPLNTHLAFITYDKQGNQSNNFLWYYKFETEKLTMLASDQSIGIDTGLVIDNRSELNFNKNGTKVFFRLKPRNNPQLIPGFSKVDIWNYKDAKLQSQQLEETGGGGAKAVNFVHYESMVDVNDRRVIRLERDYEKITSENYEKNNDDFLLVEHIEGNTNEWYWNTVAKLSIYLISTKTGFRKKIREDAKEFSAFSFCKLSAEEKFVLYYDSKQKNYFSWEISSGTIRNITKNVPVVWTSSDLSDKPLSSYCPLGIAGWLEHDAAVLIYDQNDIWKIDLLGIAKPLNITNGYGRKHSIIFRLADDHRNTAFFSNENLILSAFNRKNKENGFYKKILSGNDDPEMLTMGPYFYYLPDHNPSLSLFRILKSRDANVYVVSRMSETESPNYFSTINFKDFTPLSNIYPEKAYNWLTAQLFTWKTLDGSITQGILYKPENFDSQKKYPIIFNFYERRSDELHLYHEPEAMGGNINIPWFVSNGYLVFVPDIHYKIEKIGESAYNSIISAADFLSKLSWVDSKRMGIEGHSFGGYETDYLITHTNIFAAAISASGVCDLVSFYGSGKRDSYPMYWAEMDQGRMNATLWKKPDSYISNSPIFQLSEVNTPLLMANNIKDGSVPFTQGVEFFTAFRRIHKKVWMLQYDDGGHSVSGKSAEDLSIRATQFFDHYLKGYPPPKWMTQGIPARLKGIETGFELDPNGECGKDCPICKNKNYSSYYQSLKKEGSTTAK